MPFRKEVKFRFDHSDTKFVSELLDELNDGIKAADYNLTDKTPFLSFEGSITRLQDDKYQDYLLLEGRLKANFFAVCVGSGVVMLDEIDADVYAAIIDTELEARFGHEEDTTVYINDDEYDLYYFNEKGEFEIKEILSEYLFLNKNPYPKIANFDGPKSV